MDCSTSVSYTELPGPQSTSTRGENIESALVMTLNRRVTIDEMTIISKRLMVPTIKVSTTD